MICLRNLLHNSFICFMVAFFPLSVALESCLGACARSFKLCGLCRKEGSGAVAIVEHFGNIYNITYNLVIFDSKEGKWIVYAASSSGVYGYTYR